MNMQKIAVLIGLIVMVGMVIYPPWQSVDADGQASAMGYSFLWKPPEVQNIAPVSYTHLCALLLENFAVQE